MTLIARTTAFAAAQGLPTYCNNTLYTNSL